MDRVTFFSVVFHLLAHFRVGGDPSCNNGTRFRLSLPHNWQRRSGTRVIGMSLGSLTPWTLFSNHDKRVLLSISVCSSLCVCAWRVHFCAMSAKEMVHMREKKTIRRNGRSVCNHGIWSGASLPSLCTILLFLTLGTSGIDRNTLSLTLFPIRRDSMVISG